MEHLSDYQLSEYRTAHEVGKILGSATPQTEAQAKTAVAEWKRRYPNGVESPKPWAVSMCRDAGVPCLPFKKDF